MSTEGDPPDEPPPDKPASEKAAAKPAADKPPAGHEPAATSEPDAATAKAGTPRAKTEAATPRAKAESTPPTTDATTPATKAEVASRTTDAAMPARAEAASPKTDAEAPVTTEAALEAEPATPESILPMSDSEDALQEAVGARVKRKRRAITDVSLDDDDGPIERPGNRKTIIIAALALVGGLGIAALVLIGRINTERYFLSCETAQAVAERGRAFPPWGSTPLPGAEWKPIALPPNAQCKPQQVETRAHLESLFLELLLERASATLTTRNLLEAPPTKIDGKQVNPLDLVSLQLEQSLLLSRAPERGDQRKQVERLQGDVQYWRASLRLRDATAAMTEAARQFDQAALARPMHVSDAGSWAELLRRLSDELKAGPNGAAAAFPPAPTGERPAAPQGTALPVEPTPSEISEPPAATPDAGVPSGGVLL